ncbi:bifunctional DNA primase/polymerase [Crenalkalicoccus roseus]|uniref:bifunctional DNA primase/polymerase n=1 Tax=Crenalkalicoccus roseus TaxID=1485588 RepID=UPI0010802910|nr:bifunctional DNA primase/polymerase [Crenalkalicoccus roseus]
MSPATVTPPDAASRPPARHALAEAAIARGAPVFPCDAQKRPLTPRGFKDATTDPAEIRRTFAHPAAAMIGMPTGAASGVIAIDVDTKDGRQGRAWLDANSHRLPQTRTHYTINGGLHLVFRWPGRTVRNSAGRIAPGVDVRGDGGYIIVPPSPGYSIADDAPVADLPDWLLATICHSPSPAHQIATPSRRVEGGSAYGLAALAEECAAIRHAPDGAKHATVNKAAYAIGGLVSAGELEEGLAWAELRAALATILPRCEDPRAAERTLQRAFAEGMAAPRTVPDRAPEALVPAVHTLTDLARRHGARRPAGDAASFPIPPELMDVPGALRLFVEHCDRTAISPQPFLALAAGICMIGALAGRRYRTSTDLRTNVYAIGVADSGAGKDHARKQIRRCLYAANLVQFLGGSDIASGTAMRTALIRHPSILFQIDEFGDWLSDVLGQKASAHRKQIASYLKELYSSANTVWHGTEYADQSRQGRPREDIHQPNACLYGTTTPGQLWSAIAGSAMHDGLMARMLLFVSPCSYPDEQEPELTDPAPELIAALQAIAAGPADPATGEIGNLGALMLAGTTPQPLTVPETPDATAARQALRREQLARQREAEGTYVTAILGRLAENAMKLALVRAIARDPAAPVIQADDVAWGRALATHCTDTLLREAGRHVADSEYEAKLNRALDYIRRHGPISARELFRRGWRLPERERAEILRSLVESGLVVAISEGSGPAGGRPSIRYAIAEGGFVTTQVIEKSSFGGFVTTETGVSSPPKSGVSH